MTVRIGINGFGRIGRSFVRAVHERNADIEVVAVNDLGDVQTNAHLLKYDSTQGIFAVPVGVEGEYLVIGDSLVRVLKERDPRQLPWKELGVDVVLESTGLFTKRDAAASHLDAGARKVVVSAPSSGADITIVMGVNDSSYDPVAHSVVSNASCTTNCFVPMVKVIDDAFGITGGLMTTVHAYTNDQNLLDLAHKDLRRARAAAVNIVPTSTGAARATSLVLANMAGKLDGMSLRVPVQCGSITDLTALLDSEVEAGDVNEAFKAASESGTLHGVLQYSTDPIVSSDVVGNPSSCVFDSPLTLAVPVPGGTLVKVQGWYDNEWGYSNRLVDVVELVGTPA
ncbi:MAG: type I glyceraldehyde-3-phosphate dehydrogenase [Acidimicrobiales bacterium]